MPFYANEAQHKSTCKICRLSILAGTLRIQFGYWNRELSSHCPDEFGHGAFLLVKVLLSRKTKKPLGLQPLPAQS